MVTFLTTFFLWGINYVARELEEPFGSDSNDLPLLEMQFSFNVSLRALLQPAGQGVPKFTFLDDPLNSESHPAMRSRGLAEKMRLTLSDLSESRSLAPVDHRASDLNSLVSGERPLTALTDFKHTWAFNSDDDLKRRSRISSANGRPKTSQLGRRREKGFRRREKYADAVDEVLVGVIEKRKCSVMSQGRHSGHSHGDFGNIVAIRFPEETEDQSWDVNAGLEEAERVDHY